jgi:hypothetical protein
MSGDMVPVYNGAVTIDGVADPFARAFQLAQPALDAVIELRKPLAWLSQRRRSGRRLFNPKDAAELVDLIPTGSRLASIGVALLDAIENPASEAWMHGTLSIWLESEPGAVSINGDYFRCAVADSLYRDPTCWETYEPGVSAAIIACAIREARLEGALAPGAFVKLCLKHRRRLKVIHDDAGELMELRYQAEDELERQGLLRLTYDDADGEEIV